MQFGQGGGGAVSVCMPVRSGEESLSPRLHLGSVRVDFMDTHPAYCTVNKFAFCYAKCEVLQRMTSKMLRGTAAVALEAACSETETGAQLILVVCNGIVVGSVGGETAATLAGAIAAGELDLVGGNRAPSWSEADFDVFLLGHRRAGAACEWAERLSARCDGFEAHVWAEKRDCSSGTCECC